MDQPLPSLDAPPAPPDPRRGAVPACETALAQALGALRRGAEPVDLAVALSRAGDVLHTAGWLSALRFADALVLALPPGGAAAGRRQSFEAALKALQDAVTRRDLHELACSPCLFDHYRALRSVSSARPHAPTVAIDELALTGRPVPAATLCPARDAARFHRLRACYERALLAVLRAPPGTTDAAAASALAVLDDCLADLVQAAQAAQAAAGDPYDFWRLAAACLRALRRAAARGAAPGYAQARDLYIRLNLVLAEQARGGTRAPLAAVRAAVALLWCEYVLRGAPGDDPEQVELLRDYGLSAGWHAADSEPGGLLWDTPPGAPGVAPPGPARRTVRDIGSVQVDAAAFEDFLQTADAAIAALSTHAAARDAGAALQAADAAYRLGDCAWTLGLGGVALLADALGLAWRRLAHAAARAGMAPPIDARALESGAHALRGMLHQIAAGMPPADPAPRLAELTSLIETDLPGERA